MLLRRVWDSVSLYIIWRMWLTRGERVQCVNAAGDHVIDVTVGDKIIDESPFICKVFDNDQIIVSGIPAQTVLSKPVSFGSLSFLFHYALLQYL